MLTGLTRFSEIGAAIPGLSDRMLSERLKELEAEGIVAREVTPSTPVRVEYMLTAKGRALAGVVSAVAEWAGEWVEAPARAPQPASSSASQCANAIDLHCARATADLNGPPFCFRPRRVRSPAWLMHHHEDGGCRLRSASWIRRSGASRCGWRRRTPGRASGSSTASGHAGRGRRCTSCTRGGSSRGTTSCRG